MIIGISGKMQSGKNLTGSIIQYLICCDKIKGFNQNISLEDFLNNTKDLNDYYNSGYELKAFASKLKDIVCLLIGCTREDLESSEFKNTPLGPEWTKFGIIRRDSSRIVEITTTYEEATKRIEVWGKGAYIKEIELNPRFLLQLLGTQCMREIIHPNLWVNSLFADYHADSGFTYPVKLTGKVDAEGGAEIEVLADPEPYDNGFAKWIITDMRFPNEKLAVEEWGGITIRVSRSDSPQSDHESETSLDHDTNWDYLIINDGSIEELIEQVRDLLIHAKIIPHAKI